MKIMSVFINVSQFIIIVFLSATLVVPSAAVHAEMPSQHLFVSPTTGDGVSSVWGVFVGVSTYAHKDLNLTYAHKDAEKLYQFFVTQFQGKIPADQFNLLQNEQAQRGPILRAIKEVLRRAQREDVVVIFLAMHGLLDASGEDLFFLTHDTDPNLPEDEGVSRHDLLRQVSKSKAGKIVLILDACHTGAFGSSSTVVKQRAVNAASINRLLKEMGQAEKGLAVFSSSSAAEFSLEGKRYCGGHGAFTCGILTGLQGEADTNRNGLVELRELYDFTYRTVTKSTRGLQSPDIDGRYDNGLPLAYTLGGPKALEDLAKEKSASSSSVSLERFRALQQRLRKLEQEMDASSSSVIRPPLSSSVPLPPLPPLGPLVAPPREPAVVGKAPALSLPQRLPSKITGKDGAPMVLVSEGEFWMGSTKEQLYSVIENCIKDYVSTRKDCENSYEDEMPRHKLVLDAFYIDKYEVTTTQYGQFMDATDYEGKPKFWVSGGFWGIGETVANKAYPNKPVIFVSRIDADAYCNWAEKRLPTEAEWEKAARGVDSRKFPWGDDSPTGQHANFNTYGFESEMYEALSPVGLYTAGVSPYGAYDMAGNAAEWVSDSYQDDYYKEGSNRDLKGPDIYGIINVVRGRTWLGKADGIRATQRRFSDGRYRDYPFGFRCAKDA